MHFIATNNFKKMLELSLKRVVNYLRKYSIKASSKDKLILLLVGLCSRTILGLIFFGSIDFINALNYSRSIMAGQLITIPYFPIIVPYLWFGGVINAYTSLPIAFGYKIIPLLFDSLIPLLLFEILTKKKYRFAFRAGLLYAISPVALLITVFHVQYDSVFLFFLLWSFYIRDFYKPSLKTFFLFGVTFGFMFLIKPMGLMFLPLALQPIFPFRQIGRRYITLHLLAALGLGGIFLLASVFFKAFNYGLQRQWLIILEYANHGVQIFGLPFAKPFSDWAFLHSRIWIIVLVCGIAFLYHLKIVRQYKAILLTFALLYAMVGLNPQYLIWILPFLLVEEHIRLAGVYTILVGTLLAFYYFNPNTSFVQWENLTTFTTLRRFSFLMPPVKFYGHTITILIKIGLNYLLPAFGAITFIYGFLLDIIRKLKEKSRALPLSLPAHLPDFNEEKLNLLYLVVAIGNWVVIGLCYVTLHSSTTIARFNSIYLAKMAHYNFENTTIPTLMIPFIGNYSHGTYFNIITLLVLLSVGSGIFMLFPWKVKSKSRS